MIASAVWIPHPYSVCSRTGFCDNSLAVVAILFASPFIYIKKVASLVDPSPSEEILFKK
jgi:hypothetical protein